ncbi:type II inositol-1-1,4,5-trisphosphate 5-phosphatase rlated, putative [Entamoeba dispar SAW760]|uniref:Type II inositol-1-1,4,5-trisphosphate 5-phosphatase rlated, putative n=1 Tax=Entamoeba dispar (strain ATCC PRA-260 / SAW760) TaxID=370354 RepID=B0E7I9_ENTDS|nr:type II inositol-1-1,4,5-trisphosphate 5-phosphatase rlated, putative [Entamoeba dispar SAW760]EDR29517.1 type II inositol-1-1,4,5-trisphosphate 5-phosphatase rlated, putative [Entamoeba dispar SAW760]|eukprot:EDR29517.1 type II inositol-1-1,4,5-trisphosphate 5-phosphatase rlated, putative [Entamoeba dispar SAW760]
MSFSLPSYVDPTKFELPISIEPLRPNESKKITENDYIQFYEEPEKWFNNKMKERWFNYTEITQIKTTLITWNVAESNPSTIKIENLFNEGDLFVICLEEIDMSISGVMTFGQSELCLRWQSLIEQSLTPKIYECIFSQQHGGLAMFIFIKKIMKNEINDISVSTVSLGTLGMANKGAIGISCRIGVCRILFVGAHFSANVGPDKCDECYITARNQFQFPILPKNHDYEIWLGDFNYRLNGTEEQIKKYLNDPIKLIITDQLNNSVERSSAFGGFIEAPITFLPTYKFEKGTNNYDWKRLPAWCDRVMFRVHQSYQLSIHKYERIEIYYSDHLPVRCTAIIKPRKINNSLLKNSWEEILELSNYISNALVPTCELSTKRILFGEIIPYKTVHSSIEITNTGRIPVSFNIIYISTKKGEEINPTFIETNIIKDNIPIKQKISISISITMTAENIHLMRKIGNDFIMQIMIQDGGVFFVEIIFKISQTSFGLSLKQLLQHPEPFIISSSIVSFQKTLLPKEIILFINTLNKHKEDPKIFTTLPTIERFEIYESIFHSVDSMEELDKYNICALSEAFILYIQAMGGIFIPTLFISKDKNLTDNIIEPENMVLLRVICSLCKEISKVSPLNLSLNELLSYFSQALVNRKLEMNEFSEITNEIVTCAQNVRSIEKEMTEAN